MYERILLWSCPVLIAVLLICGIGMSTDQETDLRVKPLQMIGELPLFDGLGKHTRPVSKVESAQKCFDQGLAFLFAFNHDEARRAFAQACVVDPDCTMAYWGIAITYGSHINRPFVKPKENEQALAAIRKAKLKRANCRAEDQALIDAIALRFAENAPEDRTPLNDAYSQAMKQAWEKYPRDADIGALYAESIMNLRPWDLWTADGKPHPGTPQLLTTLEAVMKVKDHHPLALHLYIHAVEASPHPEKAVEAADRLRQLQPGLGHMVHMPSHIDVRTGRWQLAIEANERAIEADATYRKRSPKQDFYHLYMAHNAHMLTFAAMMSGQSKQALSAIREMIKGVPAEWVAVKENAAIADGFLAAPLKVMMRFGKWEEILKEPEMPEVFPIARTLRHYARGVAYAALGKIEAARTEQKLFREAISKTPPEALFGNNKAHDLYAVAEPTLEGEILFREGKLTDAIAQLRVAVQKDDFTHYDEPPGWIIPARHPLGAFLMANGEAAEAEKVYREDLKRWPHNGWSLYGLMKSLKAQGKTQEAYAIELQWQRAWSRADVSIEASCKCAER